MTLSNNRKITFSALALLVISLHIFVSPGHGHTQNIEDKRIILNNILLEDEYQPREEKEEAWDALQDKLTMYIKNFLHYARSYLGDIFVFSNNNSSLPDWVKALIYSLKYIFIAVIILLLFPIVKKGLSKIVARKDIRSDSVFENEYEIEDLENVIMTGDASQIIVAVRKSIRRVYEQQQFTKGATDRALVEHNYSSPAERQIFNYFESHAFAEKDINDEEILDFINRRKSEIIKGK